MHALGLVKAAAAARCALDNLATTDASAARRFGVKALCLGRHAGDMGQPFTLAPPLFAHGSCGLASAFIR